MTVEPPSPSRISPGARSRLATATASARQPAAQPVGSPRRPTLPRRIDFALVTHGHPDHLAMETLVRLRLRIGTLVVPRHFGLATGDPSLRRESDHLLSEARARGIEAMRLFGSCELLLDG